MLRTIPAVTAMTALLLTGCGGTDDDPSAGSKASSTPTPSASAAEAPAPAWVAEYGLADKTTAEIIDHLDRLALSERPADLIASVRPDELLLTAGDEEVSLPAADDAFYVSVAPYVDQTHECFYHSLTTCQGELQGEDVDVTIVTDDGDVLVDEQTTTYDNGFVGFWLPRDVEGTIEVTHEDHSGAVEFGTGKDDPTCITTLQLS